MAIKAVGFSKVRKGPSNIFAMHYGDINFFRIFISSDSKIGFFIVKEMKRKTKKIEWISRFKYA